MCFTLNSTWRTSNRHSLYGLLHPTMLVSSLGMKQCDMLGVSTNSDCAITRCYTVYPKKYAHGFCFAVLCCGYTLTDFPYPSGLLYWHCGNLTIAPVPAKQPWWLWINTSCEFIMNDCITTTKQSTTKPCAYLLGYTVGVRPNPGKHDWQISWIALIKPRRFQRSTTILVVLNKWMYNVCSPPHVAYIISHIDRVVIRCFMLVRLIQ